MNKIELALYIRDNYKSEIEKADAWIASYISNIKNEDFKWSKSTAKYMKNTIGLLMSAEEILTGKFEDISLKQSKGDEFCNLDVFQNLIISMNYRYCLLNKLAQKEINNIDITEDSIESIAETLIDKKQKTIILKDYIPPYTERVDGKLIFK